MASSAVNILHGETHTNLFKWSHDDQFFYNPYDQILNRTIINGNGESQTFIVQMGTNCRVWINSLVNGVMSPLWSFGGDQSTAQLSCQFWLIHTGSIKILTEDRSKIIWASGTTIYGVDDLKSIFFADANEFCTSTVWGNDNTDLWCLTMPYYKI